MVLRPTVLRYKGKARKIDSQKVKQMQDSAMQGVKNVEEARLGGKSSIAVIFVAMFIFASKYAN